MNFNHLEYAVAIAEYGSISKASQSLYLSQLYLSGLIRNLESELGYSIFERTRKGVTLTKKGELFIKSAQIILLEFKRMKELNTDDPQTLNLATYYSPYIAERFFRFRNQFSPKYTGELREMGNFEVMDSIVSGESSLGIIFYVEEKKDFYAETARERRLSLQKLLPPMELLAVISPHHPLANRDGILLGDLQNYPCVSYDDMSSNNFLQLLNLEGHPQLLKVSDRVSLYDALRSGAYLSVSAYQNTVTHDGLKILPFLDRKIWLYSGYVISHSHRLTSAEKDFLDFLTTDC